VAPPLELLAAPAVPPLDPVLPLLFVPVVVPLPLPVELSAPLLLLLLLLLVPPDPVGDAAVDEQPFVAAAPATLSAPSAMPKR
jgi:hypothetical protein